MVSAVFSDPGDHAKATEALLGHCAAKPLKQALSNNPKLQEIAEELGADPVHAQDCKDVNQEVKKRNAKILLPVRPVSRGGGRGRGRGRGRGAGAGKGTGAVAGRGRGGVSGQRGKGKGRGKGRKRKLEADDEEVAGEEGEPEEPEEPDDKAEEEPEETEDKAGEDFEEPKENPEEEPVEEIHTEPGLWPSS